MAGTRRWGGRRGRGLGGAGGGGGATPAARRQHGGAPQQRHARHAPHNRPPPPAATRWTRIASSVRGVSEETTTGVHRLYQMMEAGSPLFPPLHVNESVTKSKVDTIY